jgi:hypothetical protein
MLQGAIARGTGSPFETLDKAAAQRGEKSMPRPSRIDQLKNAGIVDPKKLGRKAKNLIDNMTDDEFHAIVTVHAKISNDGDRKKFRDQIHTMGF